MGTSATNSGKISVLFHYDDQTVKKRLNSEQLTALLGADLIFIDQFKEERKIDKKVWKSHVNGVELAIYLKSHR
ncbi:hypothetical protein [Metabacillus rhizolycopersici]|uniref:Uncharacterized protein n=1 Tax=Metabacillus rhizolycopersici TaxID=2875709 RepID=A0ABS7ULU8_9BACI|nr:hypothetical protein [Metabacillus rhizolycopersici]MBZ5749067.1 hypothetical protein [Metabacillus rhizolycopersici]